MNDWIIDDIGRLRWLLLVAACLGVVAYGFAMKSRAMRAFAAVHLLRILAPDVSRGRQAVRAACVLLAMAAIVLALIGPRWGVQRVDVQQRQLDLMICLDVSRSMLAEDAGMSRLDRAKDDIRRLLGQLRGGMVGLVAFAGRAELTCPLTDDAEFLRMMLDDVGVQTVTLGGTNLGAAIDAAVKGFAPAAGHDRAILLLTDGEDLSETGVAAARRAQDAGVVIYAVGIGDEERGGLIPEQRGGQRAFVMHEGQQVWTKLDPRTLEAVARAGGGEYHPSGQVTPTERTLEWVYARKLLPRQQRTTAEQKADQYTPRFQWPAGLALVLLTIETLVSERRGGGRRRAANGGGA